MIQRLNLITITKIQKVKYVQKYKNINLMKYI